MLVTPPLRLTDLPGPPALPLLGNFLQLKRKRLHAVLERWAQVYGTAYRLRLGRQAVLVISDPELVNTVLRDRPESFRRLSAIERVQSEMGVCGVFSAEGEQWRRQRKVINQAFRPENLRGFYGRLVGTTEKLLDRVQIYADSGCGVEIQDDLMRFTVDVTTDLSFGHNVASLESDDDVIQTHLAVLFPMISHRINSPFPYWHYVRLPADRRLERALAEIDKAVSEFIERCRKRLTQNPELRNNPSNLLEAMLAAGDESEASFSDREITGNVLTMLLGGEDTTANTLTWMLYFMARFPEVQRRMQNEADQVMGHRVLIDEYADCGKLHYIEAVACETMRLKSVVPLLFMESNRDFELGGIELAAGTGLFLLLRQCGLAEKSFSRADRFDPDRWLNAESCPRDAHDRNAFLPFGAGARFCPGRGLALLEIKSAMAALCRSYTFALVEEGPPVAEEFAFVMTPRNLMLKIGRRQ